jgi:hypothetical protein
MIIRREIKYPAFFPFILPNDYVFGKKAFPIVFINRGLLFFLVNPPVKIGRIYTYLYR